MLTCPFFLLHKSNSQNGRFGSPDLFSSYLRLVAFRVVILSAQKGGDMVDIRAWLLSIVFGSGFWAIICLFIVADTVAGCMLSTV